MSGSKLMTSFASALLCSMPILATAEPSAALAIKGGPNVATLSKDFRVHRSGFTGGLSGSLEWSRLTPIPLAAQLEILYVGRGAEVVVDDITQGKIRQHYLDVVLAARPRVALSSASVYLLLGGSLSLLLKASDENAAGLSRDVTADLNRSDVSLIAGGGIAVHPRQGRSSIGIDAVFLEARHDRGFIDIDTMDLGFKNRTTSLMLGMSLRVGRLPPKPPPAAKEPAPATARAPK